MQKNTKYIIFVKLIVSCALSIMGCSGLAKKYAVTPIDNPQPSQLQLRAIPGRIEETKYYSHSKIKSYDSNELVKERDEIVEFTVQAKTLKFDSEKKFIHYLVTTIDKDGKQDLHDMAFPEEGERLEMVLKPSGEVIYAGGYPSSSQFYLPPLSLPTKPISPGETWTIQASWVNSKNGMPHKVELTSILKNIYACADTRCWDIEISGEISLIALMDKSINSSSIIKGRLLVSEKTGSVLWSLVRNIDHMTTATNKLEIHSCMVSILIAPEKEVWPGVDDDDCNPADITSLITVPGTK